VPVVVAVAAPPVPGGVDDLPVLRAAVTAAAGRAAAPDRVVRVETLPLLASGKPDRVRLTRLVAGLAAG
jgi:O-succinylbenzoic acid--CoA ligase